MLMDKNEKHVHLPFLKQLLLVLNIFFDDFEVSVDFYDAEWIEVTVVNLLFMQIGYKSIKSVSFQNIRKYYYQSISVCKIMQCAKRLPFSLSEKVAAMNKQRSKLHCI